MGMKNQKPERFSFKGVHGSRNLTHEICGRIFAVTHDHVLL
jgi:hypothetical protein